MQSGVGRRSACRSVRHCLAAAPHWRAVHRGGRERLGDAFNLLRLISWCFFEPLSFGRCNAILEATAQIVACYDATLSTRLASDFLTLHIGQCSLVSGAAADDGGSGNYNND